MSDYEILRSKMRLKLPGDTGTERLNMLRRSMGQDDRIRVHDGSEEDNEVLVPIKTEDKDRWDCETILCRYRMLDIFCALMCTNSDVFKPRKSPSSNPRKG
jgi:protein LTV1